MFTVYRSILPTLIHRFNTIPTRISARFFAYIAGLLKRKGTRIAKKKKILKNKDNVGGIRSLNFNIYIAARRGTTKRTDIKINRMEENPELDPQKYPN